ncbi:MAG TPA: hypothetical protein VL443_05965 [Cyclobacteriaceae bacterium]|nr:hypothetical protein [Cyclobacteriaceae bacterium]
MYQYKLRPAYGGNNLLLEFFIGSEQDDFMSDLFKAFNELDIQTKSVSDLWMNDEVVLELSSSVGDFSLSKDIWGFVFIMADNNHDGIKILDEHLIKSGNFEKLDVDFNLYK